MYVKLGVKKKTHNKEKQINTEKSIQSTKTKLSFIDKQIRFFFNLEYNHRKYTKVKHK